jgi:amino acid adenylation domain-containing protein
VTAVLSDNAPASLGDGGPAYPGALLDALVRAQAVRTPSTIAVRDAETELTYRDLVVRVDAIAGRLRAAGVGPDTVVGVCAPRSCDLVAALLGILSAGGAYLPVDETTPPLRLAHIVAEANPAMIMADSRNAAALRRTGAEVSTLDGPSERSTVEAVERSDGDLAYVIYTSGSTGWPKGVAVPHRAVVNRLRWMQDRYRLSADDDVVLQKTPYTFDVSVWEFFWPLLAGARLVLAAPDGHKDPEYLVDLIRRERVTTVHFVPSMLAHVVPELEAASGLNLRRIITSGEALPPALANRVAAAVPAATIENLYGPTEATVDVTWWSCRRPEPGPTVPIGYPISGVRVSVRDERDRLTRHGEPGQLFLAGVCLARGYLGREDLTAAAFRMVDGERMYATGDLVRWSDGGWLEYLGRIDHQVKLRGQRIELGEIENALLAHRRVTAAAVLLREDVGPAPRLVAYIAGEVDRADLRSHLSQRLPGHMVPSLFVALPHLPTTTSGKCDRAALPRPTTGMETPR